MRKLWIQEDLHLSQTGPGVVRSVGGPISDEDIPIVGTATLTTQQGPITRARP
ncbi:hypothetical protein C2845_PM04G11670 [Panicum miliaceum]|uniref:Uncharacterized protein n=1 Tax=Panicum miliaceum TaxID=4540 RepID=A0A3L6QTH5_PANMI|nr:hypothetical protein C2845_PM04G11670 [Panicum miliaceum]